MTSVVTRWAVMIGGLGLLLTTADVAQAAAGRTACSFTQQTIPSSSQYVSLSNLSVSVGGGSEQSAVVHLSADMCVDLHAHVLIAYSIDGGPQISYFPSDFADHQEFCPTRTVTTEIIFGDSNFHTITPYWRLIGALGVHATFVAGCMAAGAEGFFE